MHRMDINNENNHLNIDEKSVCYKTAITKLALYTHVFIIGTSKRYDDHYNCYL